MALVSQTYAGQYLNAGELLPLGTRKNALVHNCTPEIVGNGTDAKTVLVLDLTSPAGKPWPKRVVLNKTNSQTLASTYGDDTDHWIGKPVEIWAENVMFQGRMVPGVKLAPGRRTHTAPPHNGGATPTPPLYPTSAKPTPQTEPIIDDEIPF